MLPEIVGQLEPFDDFSEAATQSVEPTSVSRQPSLDPLPDELREGSGLLKEKKSMEKKA